MKPRIAPASTSKPLRILVLSPWGLGGGYSGPITLLGRLFSAISQTGAVTVDVIYRDRGDEKKPTWLSSGWPAIHTKPGSFSKVEQLRWIIRARRLVAQKRGTFDVVHLHGAYLINLLVVAGSAHNYVLLPVLERGDLESGSGVLGLVKRAFSRSVVRKSLFAAALSPGIEAELEKLELPAARTVAIPNAVDLEVFYPASGRSAPSPSAVRIGFVGKIGATKNPQLILEALSSLRERNIQATAIFVGPFSSNEFESAFMDKAERIGVRDAIHVTGYVEDVAHFVSERMDIFVLPSNAEGLPGSLVEAMACGLPSIVTDVGSMGTHVRASRGGAVVSPSGAAIAEAVLNMIQTPNVWNDFSVRSAQYAASHFSSAAVAKIYLNALNSHAESTNMRGTSYTAKDETK